MVTIELTLNEKQKGAFVLYQTGIKIGEMVVVIVNIRLPVYHIGVIPEPKGKGYARQPVQTMVGYVREYKRTVLPRCPYVLPPFRPDSDQYVREPTGRYDLHMYGVNTLYEVKDDVPGSNSHGWTAPDSCPQGSDSAAWPRGQGQ